MSADEPPTRLSLRILAVLSDGEARHGYALLRRFGTGADGHGAPRPGTLYRALDRLGREGLIASERPTASGRRGRRWRITSVGRAVLDDELTRLERLARVASRGR